MQASTAAASVAAATTCDTSRHSTQQGRHRSSDQDISPSAAVWLERCKLVGYCCCSATLAAAATLTVFHTSSASSCGLLLLLATSASTVLVGLSPGHM